MWWHLLFRGRLFLLLDVDRAFLFDAQNFPVVIPGELVAVVKEEAAAQDVDGLTDEEVFRLVKFRYLAVGSFQINRRESDRLVCVNLKK